MKLPTRMKWIDATKLILLVLIVMEVPRLVNGEKRKRQIYREHVLPALGGKIPEEAFRTDRLALNRLNKDGITVIDGVLLEARDVDRNPDNVRSKPETIKVYVTQDPRYVPPEGRYRYDNPKSVDTTYVIRKPVGNNAENVERQRINGIGNVPISHYRGGNGQRDESIDGGYKKDGNLQSGLTSGTKAHGYANFHRFVPVKSVEPSIHRIGQRQQQQQQQNYQTIHKPIVSPLVLPGRRIIFEKIHQPNRLRQNRYHYRQTWNHENQPEIYENWASFHQSPDTFFLDDNTDFFDTHQIITDYRGFLNSFHGRSYRHVGSTNNPKEENRYEKRSKDDDKESASKAKEFFTDRGRISPLSTKIINGKSAIADFLPISRNSTISYTNLTSVPFTSFSCNGKRGTFADVETNCQVFHECSGWSMTSSLCPIGTAYSAAKKRCEWWNSVSCEF